MGPNLQINSIVRGEGEDFVNCRLASPSLRLGWNLPPVAVLSQFFSDLGLLSCSQGRESNPVRGHCRTSVRSGHIGVSRGGEKSVLGRTGIRSTGKSPGPGHNPWPEVSAWVWVGGPGDGGGGAKGNRELRSGIEEIRTGLLI